MVYRYVCNGFLRQIRLRSYQSALPVPRILVLCNHLQNVVATTYIFRLQLSTFIFYNKHIYLHGGGYTGVDVAFELFFHIITTFLFLCKKSPSHCPNTIINPFQLYFNRKIGNQNSDCLLANTIKLSK